MSYADSLLSANEQILVRARQHPFVLLRSLFIFILTAFVAGVVIFGGNAMGDALGNDLGGSIAQIAAGLGLLVLLVGFIRMVYHLLVWQNEEYLVTNHRVMKVEGLISKRSADSSLEKINDAVLSQSWIGRLFNYGSLDIMTAAESTVDQFRMLRDPVDFKKAMLDAKQAYYESAGRAGA